MQSMSGVWGVPDMVCQSKYGGVSGVFRRGIKLHALGCFDCLTFLVINQIRQSGLVRCVSVPPITMFQILYAHPIICFVPHFHSMLPTSKRNHSHVLERLP